MAKVMTVVVGGTVEVEGVERDVTMTFRCYPEERMTRDYPGTPAEAEMMSARFDDTREDAAQYVNPDDYEYEALEKAEAAEYEAMDRAEAAREDMAEARREARREG